jgi:hypothetical protein
VLRIATTRAQVISDSAGQPEAIKLISRQFSILGQNIVQSLPRTRGWRGAVKAERPAIHCVL